MGEPGKFEEVKNAGWDQGERYEEHFHSRQRSDITPNNSWLSREKLSCLTTKTDRGIIRFLKAILVICRSFSNGAITYLL